MVDPTWGNTTGGVDYFSVLDFDHFAFVIKGEDSTYPLAPGDYTTTSAPNPKDIQVSFVQSLPADTPLVKTVPGPVSIAIAGFPIKNSVTIDNLGPSYLEPQLLYISSNALTPPNQIITTAGIPPYGHEDVEYSFNPVSFLTNANDGFTIQLEGNVSEQSVQIMPFFLTPAGIGGILVVIFTIIIFIIARMFGRLSVFRRR
jgi:hypothetical protein